MDTSTIVFFVVVIVLNDIWLSQAAVSFWKDRMFTVDQMNVYHHHPSEQGIPWLCNTGLINDGRMLNPLFAVMATTVHWDSWECWLWMAAALVITLVIHRFWSKGSQPNSIGYNKKLLVSGKIHVVYMTFALGLIGQVYFSTSVSLSRTMIWIASIILAIHLPVGTLLIQHFIPKKFHRATVEDKLVAAGITLGGWALLFWRTSVLLAR